MTVERDVNNATMSPQVNRLGGQAMVGQELWAEIRRAHEQEKLSVAALARRFDLDRKTVRRCLRTSSFRPYQRAVRADTLLASHAEFLRRRAPEVDYSARILYQELRRHRGYGGSYETVKLFVRPLRRVAAQAERALVRFETPPGWQSQIDWGEAWVYFRHRPVKQHLFVLTLGFSRRGFYCAYPNERLSQFLDAHERAFEHFSGHTREHLYDRPRTVCRPGEDGKVVWNSTFKAFADYWGFEPRLCRAYRAQTKGKVESGVKYVKRNFLPGRTFLDQADFEAQLAEWTATIADVREHGTTHERPIDRFERERAQLIPTLGQPGFRLAAHAARIVADDYLVSFETNRYSVPFTLIGQTVEVERCADSLRFHHRGEVVATHAVSSGKHQLVILPEHGPGAIARNARRTYGNRLPVPRPGLPIPEVEVRDLAIYEQLVAGAQEVWS
jgi:transposase